MSPRSKKQAAAVRDARSESILDAALRAFVRLGFHGVTMAGIAREAAMSYGLAYHYFKSKDHLFAELVRIAYETSFGLFLAAKAAPVPPERRVRLIFENLLAGGVEGKNAMYFSIVLQAITLESVPPAIVKLNAEYLPRYFSVMEEILPEKTTDRKGVVTCFMALMLGLPFVLERQKGAVVPAVETILKLSSAN